MNIDNLQVGQTIKDYPSLCAACGLQQVTGKSKQLQMKKLSQYLKLKKLKRGYIVEEIIDYPNPVINNPAKSPYIKLIETLLMAQLVNNKSQSIEITYKQLFQTLYMACSNYNDIYKQESYDYFCRNIMPISKEVHADYRRMSYNEIKRKIKCALDSMKKRMLIDYKENTYVCYEDENGYEIHKEPTDAEIEEYLRIGRALLDKYNCKNLDELDTKHVRRKYEEELSKQIKDKLGWKYKYKKLKIINAVTDSEDLLEKEKKDLVLQGRKNNIEITKEELNHAIKSMLNRMGENNHRIAVQKLEEWEKGDEEWGASGIELPKSLQAILFRAKENYLPAWNILSDYYIEGNEKAAKDKAKDYTSREVKEDEINLFKEN